MVAPNTNLEHPSGEFCPMTMNNIEISQATMILLLAQNRSWDNVEDFYQVLTQRIQQASFSRVIRKAKATQLVTRFFCRKGDRNTSMVVH